MPKTLYQLVFNENDLIQSCIKSITEMQVLNKAMVSFSKATLTQTLAGLEAKIQNNGTTTAVIAVDEQPIPDILGVLQEKRGLRGGV